MKYLVQIALKSAMKFVIISNCNCDGNDIKLE